jgi:hypothetical protein
VRISDSNAHGIAKHQSYCYCDSYLHGDPDGNADSYSHPHKHANSNTYSNANGNSYWLQLVCRSGHAYGAGPSGRSLFPG